ncbi:NAD(P)/FAD-dependent oxidoreductase, partial [Candidatus Bathyarchaeota archaeon]|nr:NAD(P)/FAD-dependent oxidoreductase [Candidatus Bathyarchaeota archaeon]
MNFDTTVIGAGPTGSTVAEAIAKKGYDVLILEEHPKIGLPQHCAGKISANASKELNLPRAGILQEIRGATFCSPDMNLLSVERHDAQAYIFDRAVLDNWLSEKAVDAGAALLTGSRAINISIGSQGVKITFKQNNKVHQITSRIVVGADGATSSIAQQLGLYSKVRSKIKVAVQREITGLHDVNSEFVEIYLGSRYAPGFFAWIVP